MSYSECPRCEGTGFYARLPLQSSPCAVCNGKGWLGDDGLPANECPCRRGEHRWTGKCNSVPGEPDDWIEYCDVCGIENPGSWVPS